MSFTESVVEEAALEWFGDLGEYPRADDATLFDEDSAASSVYSLEPKITTRHD